MSDACGHADTAHFSHARSLRSGSWRHERPAAPRRNTMSPCAKDSFKIDSPVNCWPNSTKRDRRPRSRPPAHHELRISNLWRLFGSTLKIPRTARSADGDAAGQKEGALNRTAEGAYRGQSSMSSAGRGRARAVSRVMCALRLMVCTSTSKAVLSSPVTAVLRSYTTYFTHHATYVQVSYTSSFSSPGTSSS